MTRDDIIKLAREAGFPKRLPEFYEGCFERLIVAAYTQGRNDEHATVYEAPLDPILAEREACAKVCEDGINNATDWDSSEWDQACENRAFAIRARGQA